jgi:putative oxidoreductase
MKKLFFDCGTRDATASLGILSLRVLVGLMMFIGHGLPKIQNFATRKEFFYVPDFFPFKFITPPVSLMLCIGAEVGAAVLLIIGLATRPAAFALGFAMVVAAFGALGNAPWFLTSPTLVETKELSVMYLIPMVAIILSGAGSYSLDSILHKEDKRRRW